jgi:polysaccharide biosynthesis/export protein
MTNLSKSQNILKSITLAFFMHLHSRIKLLTVLVLFTSVSVFAQIPKGLMVPKVDQLSEKQIQEFLQKAQASGMTPEQIEKMALAQGIPATEVAKMRERITQVQTGSTKTGGQTNSQTARVQVGEVAERTDVELKQDSTKSKVEVSKTLPPIFGMSLFANKSMSFEPNLRVATPRNYILGPDDELSIEIFGNNFDSYKARVSPEGSIKILNLPPIYVLGRSIEQAESMIVNRLKMLYGSLNQPGSGTYAQVTLGNVRTIKVTLTGNLQRPGAYSVSSLSTVFNALFQAGGPSSTGSFRNIKLIRDNKQIRIIDLYDFLLRADQKDNIRLQDQDVILVPDYETRVEVVGEIKRPAIYEMQKDENLKTLLRFAGGFTDQAYMANLKLRRNTSKELKILNISQEEVENFGLRPGDKITVNTILDRYENKVTINGAVFRPGDYALEKGTSTVKELIQKAEGLREDALKGRATITRESENLDPEVITFDVSRLLKGEVADIPLKREDIVNIISVAELREKRSVSINGAVNNQGVFPFIEHMTLGDLIVSAGGFMEAAQPSKIEVARRIKDDTTGLGSDQNMRIFNIGIDPMLGLSSVDKEFILQPWDLVSIRFAPRYEIQRIVGIDGEVQYPGFYAIKDNEERIVDLIKKVGGAKKTAFLKGARLIRKSKLVALDLQKAMDDPNSAENILLVAKDSIFVPRRLETVALSGSVINPLSVTYKDKNKLMDYVSEAGGLAEKADKKRIYVTYANGSSDYVRNFLFFKRYPKVEKGCEIIVPVKPEDTVQKMSPGERVATISALGSLTIGIISLINILNR